ncbi:hypothetical protein MHBO_002939 [Bonamia ostreae]|uniref:Uncharacterized protein n=1 Tax=Bonamia ostreae TaxID=126728 RepID=A0ABV2AP16_9EUKA
MSAIFEKVKKYFGATTFDESNSNELFEFFQIFYGEFRASLPVEKKREGKIKILKKKVKNILKGATEKKSENNDEKKEKGEKKIVKVVRKVKKKKRVNKKPKGPTMQEVIKEAAEKRKNVKTTEEDIAKREKEIKDFKNVKKSENDGEQWNNLQTTLKLEQKGFEPEERENSKDSESDWE